MKCCEKLAMPRMDRDKVLDIVTVAAAITAVMLAAAAVFNLLYQFFSAMKEIRRTMPVVRKAAQIYVDERTPEDEDDFDPEEILAKAAEAADPGVLDDEMIRTMQEELEEAKYL